MKTFLSIVFACEGLQHPLLFKALYLFGYFSFLRFPNILPHTTSSFDTSRHLCIEDSISTQDAVVVVVKWSKTMQDRAKVTTISLSSLSQSQLCSWKALKAMLASRSLDQDLPMFQVPLSVRDVPLTDSVARKHLKNISRLLAFQKPFTFHDFRRGVATWAFRHGVPFQDIQALVFFMCLEIYIFFGGFSCGCLFLCLVFNVTTLYWVPGDLEFALSPVCMMLYCSLLSNYIYYHFVPVLGRMGI